MQTTLTSGMIQRLNTAEREGKSTAELMQILQAAYPITYVEAQVLLWKWDNMAEGN